MSQSQITDKILSSRRRDTRTHTYQQQHTHHRSIQRGTGSPDPLSQENKSGHICFLRNSSVYPLEKQLDVIESKSLTHRLAIKEETIAIDHDLVYNQAWRPSNDIHYTVKLPLYETCFLFI